jgi:chemotaxis family two-component system response regulator Rcp1
MPKNAQFQILLVEDSSADVRMVVESLRNVTPVTGLNVASDGVEALRFLRREGNYSAAVTPDLVLLDLRMPKKNGFWVLQEIKQDASLSRIPTVVLSSSALEMDVSRAYYLHADYYLAKPYDLEEFTREMQFLVGFWTTIAALPEGEQNEERIRSLPHHALSGGVSHGLGEPAAPGARPSHS